MNFVKKIFKLMLLSVLILITNLVYFSHLFYSAEVEFRPSYTENDHGKIPKETLINDKQPNVKNYAGYKDGTIDATDGYIQYGNNPDRPDYEVQKLAKEVSPGLFDITLKVKGQTREKVKPIDIVLVVDMSGSMNTDNKAGQIREGIKKFLSTIVENNLGDHVNVGLVGFSDPGNTTNVPIKSVTDNQNIINDTLSQKFYGHTFIQDGLRRGVAMLEANKNSEHQKLMIVLTDGLPTHSYHVKEAVLDEENIPVFSGNYLNNGEGMAEYKPMKLIYASAIDYNLIDFSNKIDTPYFLERRGFAKFEDINDYNRLTPFDLTDSQGNYYYLAGQEKVNNTWVATLGEARHIQSKGITVKALGIDVRQSGKVFINQETYGGNHARLQRLTSKNGHGEFEYRATPKPKIEEIPWSDGSSELEQAEKIKLQFTDSISDYLLEQTEDVLTRFNTVVGGTITDPLGEQYRYDESSPPKVTGINIADSQLPVATKTNNQVTVHQMNLGKDQEVSVTYRVRLKTETSQPDYWYPMNGKTTFSPTKDAAEQPVEFGVPSGKLSKEQFVTLKITKKWNEFNQFAKRPKHIELTIGRNNSQLGQTELTGKPEDDTWEQNIEFVTTSDGKKNYFPKFDNQGQKLAYQVLKEAPVDGYEKGSITNHQDNSFTITNRQIYKPLHLTINKVASYDTTKQLSGAEFEVSGGDLTKVVKLQEIDSQYTNTELQLSKNQTYVLKEIKAPDNYKKSGPWDISVDSTGTITIKDPSDQQLVSQVNQQTVTVTIPNDYALDTHLVVKKFQQGAPVLTRPKGFEFHVRRYQDKWQTEDTQFQSQKVLGNEDTITNDFAKVMLVPGYYDVQETKASLGYHLDSTPIRFQVTEDGRFLTENGQDISMTKRPTEDGFYRLEKVPTRLLLAKYNAVLPTNLTLFKQDARTGKPIKGVTFSLGQKLNGSNVEPKATGTTNDLGQIVFDTSSYPLQANTTYYMKEITTPDEYRQLPGYFRLIIKNKINSDKSVDVDTLETVVTYVSPNGDETTYNFEMLPGDMINQTAITITNDEKGVLPMTGGNSFGLLIGGGSFLLISVGGYLLYVYRREWQVNG